MEGVLLLLLLTSLKWFVILINAEATNTTFPILNATDLKSFNKSSILRYGHHRTQKCSDFEKTYVCINSCLERGYDIASANEDCECTCFKDKVKSKYIGNNKKNWKIPTTYRPPWAGSNPSKRPKGKFVLVTSYSTTYKIPDFLKNPVNDSDLYSELKSSKEDESHVKSDEDNSIENHQSQEKSNEDNSIENGESQENSDKDTSKENSESQEKSDKDTSKEKSESQEKSDKDTSNEKSESQEESDKDTSEEKNESQEKSDNVNLQENGGSEVKADDENITNSPSSEEKPTVDSISVESNDR